MDDNEIECLPDDFVGVSRPSKVIERLYQKRATAENNALEQMNIKRGQICEKYEKLIEKQSGELKENLEDIKGLIKNELYDSKLKANNDNAKNLEKESFDKINATIQNYTRRRHDLVEEFYNDLVNLEKRKSNELKGVLMNTYEEIKKISFKLPREYDECIELEIEKINQSILCNHRNYFELKNHLQLEIENDGKHFIEELRHVKECWVKFLRNQTEKAIMTFRSQNFKSLVIDDPAFFKKSKQIEKNELPEILEPKDSVSSLIKLQQAEEWLRCLRHTLARLDSNAQKILANFKQAAVLVFNRFFQELKVIAEQLNDMIDKDEINSLQCEMYTPTLEEIKKQYDVELETVQKTWNDLADQLTKTVDNTYNFLHAGATLWEKHFKRTEILQVLILKDIDYTVKNNNSSSEPFESKLNVLIDNLRQEPSKDKLNKTLEDIKKLLVAMEELYKAQNQSEFGVFKKYKPTQEFKTDILLAEIKRFLTIYPPDLEKDPKIQRKRASQTSEIAETTEALIPNQMMYCKYQIDAVSNWQFGLWEAVTNYTTIAKAEILTETEQWVKIQGEKLDRRLQVRLGIHALRMEKITGYIYDIRLEELCIHESRFEEHKMAVEKRTDELKEECGTYLEKCEEIYEKYNQEVKELETKSVELSNSGMISANLLVLKAKTEKCIEEINELYSEYLQKSNNFFERTKASHIEFCKNLKLFSEGGNFAIQETKEYLKHIAKIEAQLEKSLVAVRKDVESATGKITTKIESRYEEAANMIECIKEEYQFNETIQKEIKSLKDDLIKKVCDFHIDLKTNISRPFEESKLDIILHFGDYDYFHNILEKVTDIYYPRIEKLGLFLNHSSPIILYSDKMFANKQLTRKNENQDLTSMLFNFNMNEINDNYLISLNKILLKYWNGIMEHAKVILVELLEHKNVHAHSNSCELDLQRIFLKPCIFKIEFVFSPYSFLVQKS